MQMHRKKASCLVYVNNCGKLFHGRDNTYPVAMYEHVNFEYHCINIIHHQDANFRYSYTNIELSFFDIINIIMTSNFDHLLPSKFVST